MALSFSQPLVLKCHPLKEAFLAHPCHSLDTDPVGFFLALSLPDMSLNICLLISCQNPHLEFVSSMRA